VLKVNLEGKEMTISTERASPIGEDWYPEISDNLSTRPPSSPSVPTSGNTSTVNSTSPQRNWTKRLRLRPPNLFQEYRETRRGRNVVGQ
jgi:hypothetical protein